MNPETPELSQGPAPVVQEYRIRYRNLPIIAIAGRPNVGKSTLFNRLLRKRKAITDPTPGVTRDPIEAEWVPEGSQYPVLLVDTGGYKLVRDEMDELVANKALETIARADLVLLVLDAVNITPEDEEFASMLRKYTEKTIIVVNKADSPERDAAAWNHANWGFKNMVCVSAEHGRNIGELSEMLMSKLDFSKAERYEDKHDDVRVAIMGKPNTGKSTLLNRFLGTEKSIVSDIAGTTRDVVEGLFEWKNKKITVLDTAGIRRKAKVTQNVEYYSVNRAIKTIEDCDVVIFLIDAQEGLSDQDKKIVALAAEKGRGIVFALNKWDVMPAIKNGFEAARDKLRYFFGQMAYAPVLPLSAKDGTGVPKLLDTVLEMNRQLNIKIETSRLNKVVQAWLEASPPPSGPRTRFKLRYAIQTQANPVNFAFFASRPDAVSHSYTSFLKNKIRSELGFGLIPIGLEIRASHTKERPGH